jgi:peroxiredoxin
MAAPTLTASRALLVACGTLLACRAASSGPEASAPDHSGKPAATAAAAPAAAAKEADPGEDLAAKAGHVLVGRRAPAAAFERLDGRRVQLADLLGKQPVYLKFWDTWCKPCREQMPHLEKAYRTYGDRIAVFAVNLGLNDPIETVRAFQAEHALTVPVAFDSDGALAEGYHVSVTPQHVLIDRAGIVRYVGHGATSDLDRALEALLREDAAPADPPAAAPATPAPDEPLSLTLLDGSAFTLAAHADHPVALTFVAAWCDTYLAKSRSAMATACAAHVRRMESLRRARADITWVTIAHPVWTSADDLEEYRKRLTAGAPIGIDDKAAWFHRYRIHDVPTTVLLDGRGAEVERVSGPGDDLPRALARLPRGAHAASARR